MKIVGINEVMSTQENKELLIAIIEVFIHDPLFNWCLNDTTTETKEQKEQETPKSGKVF